MRKVYLAANFDDGRLRNSIRAAQVPIEELDKRKATSMVESNAPHQGIVALVSLDSLVVPVDTFLEALAPTSDILLVLLSEVQDPHNVGAIIRSCAAFGVAGVLLPTRKQSPITGSVIKASAGMAFEVPLIAVENMQQTIAQLKKKGFHVHGLAANGARPLPDERFDTPTLLVLGNEAQGIAPAARTLCDDTLSIPMPGNAESLNVAASAAVALYAWSLKHKHPLP
jgi:23S rRNA (guanosine2251-2'-O)-methyltransferase